MVSAFISFDHQFTMNSDYLSVVFTWEIIMYFNNILVVVIFQGITYIVSTLWFLPGIRRFSRIARFC